MAGMPMILIAEALGHTGGTKIVEEHYGHLTDDYRDHMIRDHALGDRKMAGTGGVNLCR